jgi:hypothetical protein
MVEYTIEYAKKALMSLTEDDRHWISEQLERVETRLLTEFHGWASPFEARQRSHTAVLRAIDVELEALTDRVKKLEPQPGRRRNLAA